MEATNNNWEFIEKLALLCQAAFGSGPLLTGHPVPTQSLMHHGLCRMSRSGFFGQGKQVQARTVASAFSAICKTISLANPNKIPGSDKPLPWLQQTLEGWAKEDPPTMKKLLVEVDTPRFLTKLGTYPAACPPDQAVSDLALIAVYYLLQMGEYIVKGSQNSSKQTQQFKLGDVTSFKTNGSASSTSFHGRLMLPSSRQKTEQL